MPDIYEIHRFYQANIPEYQKKDVLRVTKGFLQLLGWATRKPYKILSGKKWEEFQHFVCVDWQGEKIRAPGEKVQEEVPPAPVSINHGRCDCGGRFVKRENRQDRNFFLGCSNYPKCKKTKHLTA